MRGTPKGYLGKYVPCGIIPAYAGNTAVSSLARLSSWDHPRVCGEHQYGTVRFRHDAGSSPRMRGTLWHSRHSRHRTGIIPAYAGNTRQPCRRSAKCGDHPRVCGEHMTMATWFMPLPGSSPRMRGTHSFAWGTGVNVGIIPAYAGNTLALNPMEKDWRDHPRVCGEHVTPWRDSEAILGSSPRMRGTH